MPTVVQSSLKRILSIPRKHVSEMLVGVASYSQHSAKCNTPCNGCQKLLTKQSCDTQSLQFTQTSEYSPAAVASHFHSDTHAAHVPSVHVSHCVFSIADVFKFDEGKTYQIDQLISKHHHELLLKVNTS